MVAVCPWGSLGVEKSPPPPTCLPAIHKALLSLHPGFRFPSTPTSGAQHSWPKPGELDGLPHAVMRPDRHACGGCGGPRDQHTPRCQQNSLNDLSVLPQPLTEHPEEKAFAVLGRVLRITRLGNAATYTSIGTRYPPRVGSHTHSRGVAEVSCGGKIRKNRGMMQCPVQGIRIGEYRDLRRVVTVLFCFDCVPVSTTASSCLELTSSIPPKAWSTRPLKG